MNSKLIFSENHIELVMPADIFEQRKIQRKLKRYQRDFDLTNKQFHEEVSYTVLSNFIDSLNKELGKLGEPELSISNEVQTKLQSSAYAINEQQIAGSTIKAKDDRWQDELAEFKKVLDEEITRPLKPEQLPASFYLAKMKRSANFSVPGAGKTAMMYGAYAYLSSKRHQLVNKLLVISPLNAFEAWRTEYLEVFGSKRSLTFMDLKDKRYADRRNILLDWSASDVVVINYHSMNERSEKVTMLNQLIDSKTMLVYDEVHRIKNPTGKQAQIALTLGPKAQYRYVLTGTPIPNTYKDIYNFLNILYQNEYDDYFGWEVPELNHVEPEEVNEKLQPFFWRTNKHDLGVPPADEDIIISVEPSEEMQELTEYIWNNEPGILAIYMRLMQASTNPELLISDSGDNYKEAGLLSDELNSLADYEVVDKIEARESRRADYLSMGVENMGSPKFKKGIELISELVAEGKKVMVWGMFVKTMIKIQEALEANGIRTNLIYGETPKEERVGLINDFRDGDVQVMVSNPATLGESISLHQTVHDAVYFEYNFNLTFMLQSRDRIHRLGLPQGQYTRYYYLQYDNDASRGGMIDQRVYRRLKEKEQRMMDALDGQMLVPIVEDDFLEEVKRIIG